MEAKNSGKALFLATSLTSLVVSSAAQITGDQYSIGDLFSPSSYAGFFQSALFVDIITFGFTWLLSYAFLALILKVWVKLLNSPGNGDWGDELEKIFFGSSGNSGYRSADSKNLLIWITGLGNLILTFTVTDFLSSVRAILFGFGTGGILVLTVVAILVFLWIAMGLFGGYLGGTGRLAGWIGEQYDNEFRPAAQGLEDRVRDNLGAAANYVGQAGNFIGANQYLNQAAQRATSLFGALGWKECGNCNTYNPPNNNHCGNCGRRI